jgi:hypothetical protein
MKKKRFTAALVISLTFLFTISCFLFAAPRGPLNFDPDNLPGAKVGVPYDVKVTIAQNVTPVGQISISEGALPQGLKLEKLQGEDTARIYGTPVEAGTFTFKIFVWCYGTNISGQTGEASYTITVGE